MRKSRPESNGKSKVFDPRSAQGTACRHAGCRRARPADDPVPLPHRGGTDPSRAGLCHKEVPAGAVDRDGDNMRKKFDPNSFLLPSFSDQSMLPLPFFIELIFFYSILQFRMRSDHFLFNEYFKEWL